MSANIIEIVGVGTIDAKTFLTIYLYIEEELDKLNGKLESAIKRKYALPEAILRAQVLDGMPHGTDIPNPVLKIVELIDLYTQDISNLTDKIIELQKYRMHFDLTVPKLSQNGREAVKWIGILGITNKYGNYLAPKMHLSYRHIYEIVNKEIISKLELPEKVAAVGALEQKKEAIG